MLLAIAACILIYCINPTSVTWMPKCPFWLLTGLKCPSCGSTRGLHALLHGRLHEAWMYNPLVVLTVPIAAVVIWRSLQPARYSWRVTRRWVYAYLVVYCLWWVLRNILNL